MYHLALVCISCTKVQGLSPKFVDKACKIVIILQNKMMCVFVHVS